MHPVTASIVCVVLAACSTAPPVATSRAEEPTQIAALAHYPGLIGDWAELRVLDNGQVILVTERGHGRRPRELRRLSADQLLELQRALESDSLPFTPAPALGFDLPDHVACPMVEDAHVLLLRYRGPDRRMLEAVECLVDVPFGPVFTLWQQLRRYYPALSHIRM